MKLLRLLLLIMSLVLSPIVIRGQTGPGTIAPPPTTTLQNAVGQDGNGVVLNTRVYGAVKLSITITGTATVNFEGRLSSAGTFAARKGIKESDTANSSVTTTTASGDYIVYLAGDEEFRARVSGWSSGAVTVIARPIPSVGKATPPSGGSGGGTGDVVGPASATDNAVVRFDSTTGKLVQNSAVTIADTSGDITGGKYNGLTVTASTGTFTLTNGKVFSVSNTLTLAGTDSTVMTFPATNATIARTDAANTFTGVQSMTSPDITTSLTSPSTTFALLNVTPTTVNAFGATTTLNLGASATMILNFGGGATASEFRFLEPSGSGTNYSAFKAVAQAANITYSLPPTVGAAGTVLTDAAGNGVLTWAAGGSGANTALSNLASVAINTDLLPASTQGLGNASFPFLASFTGNTTQYESVVQTAGLITHAALGSATNISIVFTPKGTGGVAFPAGAVATPALYFSTDTGTGLGRLRANNVDFFNTGASIVRIGSDFLGIGLSGSSGVAWLSTGGGFGSGAAVYDLGIIRSAAGVVEINSGTAATLRDLVLRKITAYGNATAIATAGWGVPAIYAAGRATAQTAANSSVATYTVGAADGSFEISANVLVTTATTHAFTVTCDYTDEGNTARTITFNFSNVGGTILTSIANTGGAVPYEGIPLHIRAKASTAITVKTAGTFTTVTYNVEGIIKQMA